MEATALSSTTGSDRGAGSDDAASRLRRIRRAFDAVLVVVFLVGITLPLVGVRVRGHGWDIASRAENRSMKPLPQLLQPGAFRHASAAGKLKQAAKFPGQFKYYFEDHFGFRSLLIRAHGTLFVKDLGVTSNPSVILGKEGWLYLANENSLEDWRNVQPFTPGELDDWRNMLEARRRFCADRGIPYLVVFAPSKYDIYPEFMPDNLTQVSHVSRLDQLLASLRETHSPLDVLDLRPPLLEAKKQGVRLFQKTDTHWNDRGAWVAYQAIIESASKHVAGVRELSEREFVAETHTRPGMDLAGLLGLNDAYPEESLELRPRISLRLPHVEQNRVEPITIDGQGPGVVMFRDSFMTSVLPFVAESFGRGVYFWEDGFDPAVITAERPAIVIQEIAQRKLMQPAAKMEKTQPVVEAEGRWKLAKPPG